MKSFAHIAATNEQQYLQDIMKSIQQHATQLKIQLPLSQIQMLQTYIKAIFPSTNQKSIVNLSSDQLHALFLLGVFVINLVWFNSLSHNQHQKINLQPFLTLLSSLQFRHCNVSAKDTFLDGQDYFERCFLFEPFVAEDLDFLYHLFQFIHQEFDATVKLETIDKEQEYKSLSKYIKAQIKLKKR